MIGITCRWSDKDQAFSSVFVLKRNAPAGSPASRFGDDFLCGSRLICRVVQLSAPGGMVKAACSRFSALLALVESGSIRCSALGNTGRTACHIHAGRVLVRRLKNRFVMTVLEDVDEQASCGELRQQGSDEGGLAAAGPPNDADQPGSHFY